MGWHAVKTNQPTNQPISLIMVYEIYIHTHRGNNYYGTEIVEIFLDKMNRYKIDFVCYLDFSFLHYNFWWKSYLLLLYSGVTRKKKKKTEEESSFILILGFPCYLRGLALKVESFHLTTSDVKGTVGLLPLDPLQLTRAVPSILIVQISSSCLVWLYDVF